MKNTVFSYDTFCILLSFAIKRQRERERETTIRKMDAEAHRGLSFGHGCCPSHCHCQPHGWKSLTTARSAVAQTSELGLTPMRWKPEAVVAMLSNAQFVDLSHEIPLYDPGTLSPLSRRGVLAQPFDGMCTWLSLFQLQGWSSTADFSHLVILEKHQTPIPSIHNLILF